MPHYRSLLEHQFLGAWDLADPQGRAKSATFTIGSVQQTECFDPKTNEKGKKLTITPRERPERLLVLGKTNGDLIAALLGPNTDDWPGKRVTIYPARTLVGRDEVDCIRVEVPDELLRGSPMIRSRVRKKLLAERGMRAVAPQTREPRQPAASSEREPGADG